MTNRILALGVLLGSSILLATCRAPASTTPRARSTAELLAGNVSIMDGTTVILRFNPPPIYRMWRAEVEECSGVQREGDPTFWIAPKTKLNEGGAIGLFVRDQRRVVFALGFEAVDWVVRHEILHDLLDVRDNDGHPELYFKLRCRQLVWPPEVQLGGSP